MYWTVLYPHRLHEQRCCDALAFVAETNGGVLLRGRCSIIRPCVIGDWVGLHIKFP